MKNARIMVPSLRVNRQFMSEFVAAEPPCLALGIAESGAGWCALVALRLERALPRKISAAGFRFGRALLGARGCEVIQFTFEFYGFATYNVLINPSNPVARAVLSTMLETGEYLFFALSAGRRANTFRSRIGSEDLAELNANMPRLLESVTTDTQYRLALAQFAAQPEPPGQLLAWVCRDNGNALDPERDPLELSPA